MTRPRFAVHLLNLGAILALTVALAAQPSQEPEDRLAQARGHLDAGSYARADSVLLDLLALQDVLPGDLHLEVLAAAAECALGQRDYNRALSSLEQALARRAAGDTPHAELEASLYNMLCEARIRLGDLDAAASALELARAAHAGAPGQTAHAEGVTEIMAGILWYMRGDYAAARDGFRAAVAILTEAVGAEHKSTLRAENGLIGMSMMLAEYREATENYKRLIATYERIHGPQSRQVALSKHNLAEVYLRRDLFDLAEQTELEVLDILSRTDGRDAEINTNSLIVLGQAYKHQARFAAAEEVLLEALHIRGKHLGEDHHWMHFPHNTLADLYFFTHRYAEAITHYQKAIAIVTREGAESHQDAAMYLNNLGPCFVELGLLQEARETFERALAFWDDMPADQQIHDEHARTSHKLGAVHRDLGDHAGAETHFTRAGELYETLLTRRNLAADHHFVQEYYCEYARLLIETGRLAEAKFLLQKALSAAEQAGPEYLAVVGPLRLLGEVHLLQGRPEEAEMAYRRALGICEYILGTDSREVMECLEPLSRIRCEQGGEQNLAEALSMALRAVDIARNTRTSIVRSLPEQQAMDYAARQTPGVGIACAVALQTGRGEDAARVWDELLRTRGLLFDEMVLRQLFAAELNKPELRDLGHRYREAVNQVATLTTRGGDLAGSTAAAIDPDDPVPADRRHDEVAAALRYWHQELAATEQALARENTEFFRNFDRHKQGLEDVRRHLPRGDSLVAFYRQGLPHLEHPVYLVFVLPRNQRYPVVLSLGDAEEIDRLVVRWRHALKTAKLNESATAGDRGGLSFTAHRAGLALRERIWDPVSQLGADSGMIFVVPTGMLSFVNFSALPLDVGSYVLEGRSRLHYLSTERDLVRRPTISIDGALLAVGAPDYDAAIEVHEPGSQTVPGQVAARGRSLALGNPFAALRFDPLPGADTEVDRVAEIYRAHGEVITLGGQTATESEIKRLANGKSVLHFATHGFFIGSGLTAHAGDGGPRPMINPLLTSGLALAGANRVLEAPSDLDDGLLTAQEIALLDLSSCNWAVLSACQTGLGVLKGDEGVVGLRRAFQQAGTRTVIMSLWAVDDGEALTWIEHLYRARFERGLSTADAMHAASLAMLEAQREANLRTLPYDWGAFIAVGDWRR